MAGNAGYLTPKTGAPGTFHCPARNQKENPFFWRPFRLPCLSLSVSYRSPVSASCLAGVLPTIFIREACSCSLPTLVLSLWSVPSHVIKFTVIPGRNNVSTPHLSHDKPLRKNTISNKNKTLEKIRRHHTRLKPQKAHSLVSHFAQRKGEEGKSAVKKQAK